MFENSCPLSLPLLNHVCQVLDIETYLECFISTGNFQELHFFKKKSLIGRMRIILERGRLGFFFFMYMYLFSAIDYTLKGASVLKWVVEILRA